MRLALTILLTLGIASPAAAAELQLQAQGAAQAGGQIVLTALLDSGGESINAIEGTLQYPHDLVKLREIRDGNSLVNFWAERPHDGADGIRFAGVTPGGYAGSGREVFSLVFDVQKGEKIRYTLRDARALINDGQGTPVSLTLSPTVILVPTVSGAIDPTHDVTLPEPFTPVRGSDPALFSGAPFIAFVTQDKQSGVDHYEVAEQKGFMMPSVLYHQLTWEHAESPFALRDANEDAYVYVKAVDRAGNERVAVLSPRNLPLRYNPPFILAILLLMLGVWVIYRRRVHQLYE